MKLFEVFGEVKIDDKGALKTLDKSESKAKKLSKGFGDTAKSVGKFGLGFGAMAAAVGGGLFAMANKSTEALDRVDKLSQKLGMTTKGFQEWDYVLSQNGATVDSMKIGMQTLAKRMLEAEGGAGKGAEAFDRLGLSATDVNGNLKTQEEMFNEAVIALQGVEDQTLKASLSNDIFAGSSKELAPLLNQSAEATENLKNKAQDLGMVQSEEAIKAGAEFQDNLDTTKRMLGAVATKLGTKLLPMFNKLLKWITDNMPAIQEKFKVAYDLIIEKAKIVYEWFNEYILPVLKEMHNWISENMPVFQKVFETVFGVIKTALEAVWEVLNILLIPILKTLFNWVDDHMDEIGEVVGGIFEGISAVIETTIGVIGNIVEAFKTAYDWAVKFLSKNEEVENADKGTQGTVYSGSGFGGVSSFGGMRADGGNVTTGSAYIVGERGPELFTPNQSGSITSNENLGGVTVQSMIVRKESDIQAIARELFNLQSQSERGLGLV